MNEWQVLILIGGILTFAVGTILPLIKILLKVNGTIQGNSQTIENVNETMQNTIKLNKEEHDYFFSSINHMKTDIEVLKEKHRKEDN